MAEPKSLRLKQSMKWNLFCFHMLEEPPVLLCITYRDHRFKTFRCCGSPASLPFPPAASRSEPVIILLPPIFSLSHSSPPSPRPCPWVRLSTKQMNVFMLAKCQKFWEVIFPQHSRPTVYICHFLFSPPFQAGRPGGCSRAVWREAFCSKILLLSWHPCAFFCICNLYFGLQNINSF